MWYHHWIILAVLAALALPVYLLDHLLLKSRGDIFLFDASGMITGFYGLWLAVHIPVSSIAMYFFNADRIYGLHAVMAVASAGILLAGLTIVSHVDSARSKSRHEARMAMREGLFDAITLEKWWSAGSPDRPDRVGVVVTFEHSGRVAASVHGRTERPDARGVYHGEMRPQKQVTAGEKIEYEFPLKYYADEPAPDVTFSFMLFRDRTGSAPEDIIKNYVAAPQRRDDGERFYAALPPPDVAPSGAAEAEPGVRE
jgi:hypothetical protein